MRVRREGERLIVERRPPGSTEIAFAWTLAALMGAFVILMAWVLDLQGVVWVALPAILLCAAAFPRQGWRVEATSRALTLTKDGLFGGSLRSWPAEEVAAVWLDGQRSDEIEIWSCRVRFKDGSVHDLLSGAEADMRRLVDMLRNRSRETPRTIGTCRVCGTGMSRRIVACASCRTPHHAECWTYAGRCSTYGCREIRVVTSESDWNVDAS